MRAAATVIAPPLGMRMRPPRSITTVPRSAGLVGAPVVVVLTEAPFDVETALLVAHARRRAAHAAGGGSAAGADGPAAGAGAGAWGGTGPRTRLVSHAETAASTAAGTVFNPLVPTMSPEKRRAAMTRLVPAVM